MTSFSATSCAIRSATRAGSSDGAVANAFVYITAGILLIPLFVFIVFPLFSADWAPLDLTWKLEGIEGLHTAIVWLSNLLAWLTRRASATDVSKRLDLAVRLLIGDGEHPKI